MDRQKAQKQNDMGLRDETRKKVERAVRLLRSIEQKEGERVEIAYSGGKDSDVILSRWETLTGDTARRV